MNKKILPDIQENGSPPIELPIDFVGIEQIKLPFKLLLRNSSLIDLVASTSIVTNLTKDIKGISMSRLLESIQPYLCTGLNWVVIKQCLDEVSKNIKQSEVKIKFEFDMPMNKKSPLSNNEYPLFYKCYFEGYKMDDFYQFNQYVKIQYSSYCPCSAALSKELSPNGFPHAQRSFAEILLCMDLYDKKTIWLEDIIDVVLQVIKTQPYPIIKRIDEQEISRIASQNPLFVEDAIRLISNEIDKMVGVIDWCIKCTHEESIHMHNAIAITWKGIDNGFTYLSI